MLVAALRRVAALHEDPAAGVLERPRGPLHTWVEGYGWRATVSFVFYSDQNSVRILSEVGKIYLNSSEFLNLRMLRLAKFRSISIRIVAKFNEKCLKIAMFCRILTNKLATIRKSLTKFCWDFQLRVVQRCDNLVDLDKCCKMSIWLQKLASIQPRYSPLKLAKICEIC